MNHLLDTEIEPADTSADREISLGAGTILGIFFGLALLCGAVFGLGYSMGRRSAQNAAPAVIMASGSPATLDSAVKPTAGSSAAQPATPADEIPSTPARETKSSVASSDRIIVGDKLPGATAPSAPPPPPPTAPGGNFVVQIAAVSSQEIADIELAALKKFGYQVAVRHEPQDQLLHIQLGPFATRKDAEAMRQNVLSHGFNAIVK